MCHIAPACGSRPGDHIKQRLISLVSMRKRGNYTGEIEVDVQYQSQSTTARFVVVSTNSPALLGRDLLRKIRLDCMVSSELG